MWRKKKFIFIAALIAVILVGSIGGVALAQSGPTDNTTPTGKSLLARVATILGIDQSTLESAFKQAKQEMRDERVDAFLKRMVDEGKLTQEQADQYKAWWNSRPDITPFQEQMSDWLAARPDADIGPLPGILGPHGMIKGGIDRHFRR